MRTVCPSCEAAYDVPAAVLSAGRTLRCARCGADFTPEPPAAPAGSAPAFAITDAAPVISFAPAPPVPAPAPVVAERLIPPDLAEEPVARSGPRLAVVTGWVASLFMLVALGWGSLAWRETIQRVWPASGRLYAVLGFDTHRPGE